MFPSKNDVPIVSKNDDDDVPEDDPFGTRVLTLFSRDPSRLF